MNVTVIMPDYYTTIPTIGRIRLKDLENGYFQSNVFGTVVWEKQAFEELCPYVIRFDANVETITYDTSTMSDGNKFRNSDTMTYYFNENLKSAMATTDDMLVNGEEFKCIKYTSDDKVYRLNNGDILVFTELTKEEYLDSVREKGSLTYGAHAYVHHVEAMHNLSASNHQVQVVSADDLDDTHSPNGNTISRPPIIVTISEALDYIEYQSELERRRNLHVRAMQHCQMMNQVWDNFNQLLNIDPSIALTQKLNMPLSATHGGNNFYNIKRCDLVIIHRVLESLFTNDSTPIYLGGASTTSIREIVMKKRV